MVQPNKKLCIELDISSSKWNPTSCWKMLAGKRQLYLECCVWQWKWCASEKSTQATIQHNTMHNTTKHFPVHLNWMKIKSEKNPYAIRSTVSMHAIYAKFHIIWTRCCVWIRDKSKHFSPSKQVNAKVADFLLFLHIRLFATECIGSARRSCSVCSPYGDTSFKWQAIHNSS